MSKRNFEEWLSTFRESINGYDYYVDFEKVYRNAKKLKTEIFVLNSLVNSENIEADFLSLIAEYPKCLKAVPILLAVRSYEIYCQDENSAITYCFNKTVQTPQQYAGFMRKTGLFDMLEEHIISHLYDYVTGVETGLNSNGRKNRGGHQMERLVESFLKKSGIPYDREVPSSSLELPLSSLPHNKRWDFTVTTPSSIYVIETNFYTDKGSKLNETARSYRLIAEEARNIPGFTFVWITDGKGWLSAKNSLHETFSVLDTLYNIADLEAGIFTELFS